MTTYSHSRLTCFENCPLQYKFKYIEKPEIEEKFEGIEAFMGSRVHDVLERLYEDLKRERLNTLKDLLSYYDEQWRKNWSDAVQIVHKHYREEDYKKTGERCIRDYHKCYEPFDQGRVIDTECHVRVKLDETGKYTLHGFIDRLDALKGGVYEIHDYKTSMYLPSGADMEQDRQLALYQIAIKQKWADVERVNLVWHFLAYDKEIRSSRTEEQLSSLKKEVIKVIQEIEKATEMGDFPAEKSDLCKWCEYAPLCPEWKHLHKTKELPPNEYLKEPGVKLVNTYAGLRVKIAELEEEENKVREALVAYAKKEGTEYVFGSDVKALVRFYKELLFPGKDAKEREALERLVKDFGEWERFSMLDTRTLGSALRKGDIEEKLAKKLKGFAREEEKPRVWLSRKKEEEE